MKYLTQNKHWRLVEDYNIDKMLYLLIDKPDKSNICFVWLNNKHEYHRDYDLPAKILENFTIIWRIENVLHRENGKPARIWSTGKKECWNKSKLEYSQ